MMYTVATPLALPIGCIRATVRRPVAWPSSRRAQTALRTSRCVSSRLSAGDVRTLEGRPRGERKGYA
jgi:hypothetical protein